MNWAMEMHDSRVLDIAKQEDGSGFILFDAYVYRSEGKPGFDAQESGWQNVRMTFRDFQWNGQCYDEHSYAADGNLVVNGVRDYGLIDYPAEHRGDICLTLCVSDLFVDNEFRGSAVSIHSEGEFELEAVWDQDGARTPA